MGEKDWRQEHVQSQLPISSLSDTETRDQGRKTEGRMDVEAADQTILFAGELDDPWVGLIVASISNVAAVRTVDVKGPIPARLSGDDERLRTVIIHRCRLSQIDVSRIEGYRQENRSKLRPEIILCYSPYVRYAELERCSQAVDLLIPEASAVDILPLPSGP